MKDKRHISTKDRVNWWNNLQSAYQGGKGKYKDMRLSDYHDLLNIFDMIEDGKDPQKIANAIESLDTLVREDYIPNRIYNFYMN